jgi:S-formylglutathione hydrolase FrmB
VIHGALLVLLLARLVKIAVPSALLSQALGTAMTLKADVLLPDSYDRAPPRAYPVLYWFHAYGDNYDYRAQRTIGQWRHAFARAGSEAIVVFPDPMLGQIYTEFADSAYDGPWGAAFTTELVPYVDAHFRTHGRYLAGHSSGAWAALWLQTTYPALFDGSWSYSPDPVDFHDFTGIDLTANPPQNAYARGQVQYLVNAMPQQFFSFDAVFAPGARNRLPRPLFDRKTGVIDPVVAAYWESHFDITAKLRDEWPSEGDALRGKLHLIVGTADTFGLQGPVERLCAELTQLGAQAECTFYPRENHWQPLHEDGGYEAHVARELATMQAAREPSQDDSATTSPQSGPR